MTPNRILRFYQTVEIIFRFELFFVGGVTINTFTFGINTINNLQKFFLIHSVALIKVKFLSPFLKFYSRIFFHFLRPND